MEGTVTSLLSDNSGNIVGVSYKDKQDDSMKVSYFEWVVSLWLVWHGHTLVWSGGSGVSS